MSTNTPIATGETATAALREPHVRRVVEAARNSHSASTRLNLPRRLAPLPDVGRPRGSQRHSRVTGDGGGVRRRAGRPGSVTRVAPHGPRGDSLPSHRSRTRESDRLTKACAGCCADLTRQAACEGRTPRQAAALTEEGLAAIRATAHLRRTGRRGRTERARAAQLRGQVDIALVSVMRDALLRRSEAAALTWADVEFRSDGSARVTVRRSKSDQDGTGTGATLYVGRAAAAELRAIHLPDASPKARVFGLRSGQAVSNRIVAAAKAAGLIGRFSGNSPRIGMARDLVASGAGNRCPPSRRTLGFRPNARALRPRRTGRGGSRGPVPRGGLADSARRSNLAAETESRATGPGLVPRPGGSARCSWRDPASCFPPSFWVLTSLPASQVTAAARSAPAGDRGGFCTRCCVPRPASPSPVAVSR